MSENVFALSPGHRIPAVEFPLSAYRLVVAAGANRDFNAIHHNDAVARDTGAPGLYANNHFLQGMWERAVREFVGDGALFTAIRGFRMNAFVTADDIAVVEGRLVEADAATGRIVLELWTRVGDHVRVGPGTVELLQPRP